MKSYTSVQPFNFFFRQLNCAVYTELPVRNSTIKKIFIDVGTFSFQYSSLLLLEDLVNSGPEWTGCVCVCVCVCVFITVVLVF